MAEIYNKKPNCIAEMKQVHSSYMIYKMQKELQVAGEECNNFGHPYENHFCTLNTLCCKHLENSPAYLPSISQSRECCFNQPTTCNKYLGNGIKDMLVMEEVLFNLEHG